MNLIDAPQREMRPDHYHAMSRSYDAALGRFRSRDVEEYIKLTDTLTLNRYLYCGANPLSYVDVMGFGYTDYVAPVKDTVEGWIRTAENWAVERLAWKENPNVTKITVIDPKTSMETVVFER